VSGFFGIIYTDGRTVQQSLLNSIAGKMVFRGPHGTNVWSDQNLGSSFALMKTGPAPQSSRQPVSLSNRFWLWGDLRLDARDELQTQLNLAISPHLTDEELLLHAWQKWGVDALQQILGDFSFALWDSVKQTLWCGRDFVGPRPFYFAQASGCFCFSNTLRILAALPEISQQLDDIFIGDFLTEGFSPDPDRTVYRDIKRLPAGHLLQFHSGKLHTQRFRTLPIEDPVDLKHPQEYLDAYRRLLSRAVRDRLPHGPTALYLSGGLDSSAVCAFALQIAAANGRKQDLKAFTLGFRAFFDDPEPPLAALTAQHLGISHEILEESELRTFESADTFDNSTPEPDDEFYFARERSLLAKIAAYSPIVLSGDGGDDVLTGQSWPYLTFLARRAKWATLARDVGSYVWDHKSLPPLRAGFRAKFRRLFSREESSPKFPDWLNLDFARRVQLTERRNELRNSQHDSEHPTHPVAYASLHSGLWAGILETEDAGWNRVPLETRAPLLDLRVLRFLLRLPQLPWCMDKYLCRQSMRDDLPQPIVNRPKTPAAGDLVHLSLSQQDWLHRLPKGGSAQIEKFVNWPKWCETLNGSKGSLTNVSLRPAALFLWLKAVESACRFQ